MFSYLWKTMRAVDRAVKRAVRALLQRAAAAADRLWKQHRRQVVSNASYTVAVGAVVAGALGFVPWRDVAAAVLTAVLGCAVNGSRQPQRHQLHIDDLFEDGYYR